MNKQDLNRLIRIAEQKKKEIDSEVEQLVRNYAKDNYYIEEYDIVMYNGFKVVIVGFMTEGKAESIKVRYKRIKYTGALDNIVYNFPIQTKVEKLETKYNGKI